MRIDKGALYAAAAYFCWGLFPLYFKLLHQASAFQIVGHRIAWSFLFLLLILALRGEIPALRAAINLRTFLIYLGAGSLLAVNWSMYVWGVNAGFVVETSLGYFINPLVSVLLGVVILREKLRLLQWIPVGLAAAGVAYLTFSYGALPWLALALAFTFGLYGLFKKLAPLGSLPGLALETGAVFPVALGYLLFEEVRGGGVFGHAGLWISLLLAFSGVVTAVPLLFFATGARRVPLTLLGLIQYLSPTLQFLTGVFLFGEPFTPSRLIGFSFIWLALILFSAESLVTWRRNTALQAGLSPDTGS